EVVAALMKAFKAGPSGESFTLGIYKPGLLDGHATTPYAIEDRGDGLVWILHYDNNYPGVPRAIEVDTKANTWRYVASTNPRATASEYRGDAKSFTLTLSPTSLRTAPQGCPFCDATPAPGARRLSTGILGQLFKQAVPTTATGPAPATP